MSDIDLRLKKADLLALLTTQIEKAKAYDKLLVAAYEAQKKASLALFRSRLKEAAKWDYETLRANNFIVHLSGSTQRTITFGPGLRMYVTERPACPPSIAERMISIREQVLLDGRTVYTISSEGRSFALHWACTWSPDAGESSC